MAHLVRAWSWTRLDGRNVLAMPTQTEIRLYDSDEFMLLSRLTPSGHRSPVAFVRWSAFHGKLASLSAEQIVVHAPQRDGQHHQQQLSSSVPFVVVCCFPLDVVHTNIRSLAFSRHAAELLFCGRHVGQIGKLDVRGNQDAGRDHALVLWQVEERGVDVAKYSPSAFVFATLRTNERAVQVWRMKRRVGEANDRQTLDRVETLSHAAPVVYLSWKPARTQWHSALESDGTTKAQYFEPVRILLTCTATRSVCIWTEREDERDGVCFNCVLTFAPTFLMHNVRWVVSKNRNISEENGVVATTDVLDEHAEWISGVDPTGVLRLWKLVGVTTSTSPTVEETPLEIQFYGENDRCDADMGVGIADVCVVAYFSQNYTGMPSKLGIVLQRMDHIIMSFHIAVGEGDQPSHVVKKSWYRSHLGSISALSAHPSLPLIASVDAHASECDGARRYDVLVYWISFSAFSAESQLIPSGVLPCDKDSGNVLCVQWVPTLHFDATPLLLVVFDSGVIDVYSRSAEADVSVVSSPRLQLLRQQQQERTCSSSPSGSEYEVSCGKPSSLALDIEFEENEGKLIVRRNSSSNKYLRDVVVGDELVDINNEGVVGKKVKDVMAMFDSIQPGAALLMRFRVVDARNNLTTKTAPATHKTASGSTASVPFQPTFSSGEDLNDPKHTVEEHQQYVTSSLENHNLHDLHGIDNTVRVGAVSMYGGWRQMFHRKVQRALSLLCVCPFYADDGDYVPNSVLMFGIESIPGKLCMWKGVHNGTDGSFELLPLQVQDVAVKKKANITAIAGERDYRQRAFSSKRAQGRNSLNSLVFIGDAAGFIEHWRCQVIGNSIHFTMMSSHPVCGSSNVSSFDDHPTTESLGPFCRRGYVYADRVTGSSQSGDAVMVAGSVGHIEVDDPNRLAVLRVDRPDELHIFEAESGLGILRAEDSITSNGRGNILGFNWCNSHVEFNIDALAVRYKHATVMYQYDTTLHRWSQIGDDIVSPLPLFDCTRDSSALLVGGGIRKDAQLDRSSFEPITNEMPVVLGKWDEPGSHLQRSMDWKAAESPQKLPMWHPYVLLTTMFGMHARVGEKDTSLAGDRASYAFSRAFSDATQMLKLLARVLQDKHSAQASASSGVFSYTSPEQAPEAAAKQAESGRVRGLDYVGRYSTLIHRSDKIDKAENLFTAPASNSSRRRQTFDQDKSFLDEEDHRTLAPDEAAVIVGAVDSMLLGKVHPLQANASVIFASFGEEHLVEMKALLSFVDVIQSLGFDLDASAADLGAKRYFSMCLFAKSLRSVVRAHVGNCTSNPQNGDPDPFPAKLNWRNMHSECEDCSWSPSLEETPSSGLLWALHSDAQQFLWEHCIEPGMLWDDLRPQWLGLWIKDVQDLRGIVERFAKVSYMRSKDAMEVCLLYVALGKKNVLSALAKISQSQSNKRLASFLDNDFSEKYWSNAAIKNAYSLLSKKQYEAAASFFLLCEPPRVQDAIRVLSVRQGDPSLALIISRLVEFRVDYNDAFNSQRGITPAGVTTKQLLEQDILPLFRRKRDVWLESCALWWLEDFEQAWAVLLPQFQNVDVCRENKLTLPTQDSLLSNVMRATHFYVNLTSLTIYFQHLHSNVNSSLLSWAKKKMHQRVFPDTSASSAMASSGKRRLQLASTADIEHAFSFAAYVCKRNGLSDTALVEMLQARHLINLHARFEISAIEASNDVSSNAKLEDDPTSLSEDPTFEKNQGLRTSWGRADKPSSFTSPIANRSASRAAWITPRRRMSFMDTVCLPRVEVQVTEKKAPPRRARASSLSWKSLQSDKPIPTAPWLQTQIADIECRRWASSAFVGKMIGIRVAREMISHFRAELDVYFRHGHDNDSSVHASAIATTLGQRHHHRVKLHRKFLNELCTPLCEQFQVDRKYVYEAGLAVMHPHAHLHIVEVCFLLSELERASTLRKWIEYVSLSMLHSCSTFASCSIAEDVHRDWESLTIQLCYILNLDSQGQICVPPQVVTHISVAVRTGIIFLGWARNRSDIVRQALALPFCPHDTANSASTGDSGPSLSSFAFEKNLHLLCRLLEISAANKREVRKTRIFEGKLGYTFLGAVATRRAGDDNISLLSWGGVETSASQNQFKIRKMYTLVLMVSVLRTLYARATVFLNTYRETHDDDDKEVVEADIATSLFIPQKLWKALGGGPLEGLKQWYALIESHLRCEFDYNVNEVPCLCGLYGLDTTAFQEAAKRGTKQPRCQENCGGDGEKSINNGVSCGSMIDPDGGKKMNGTACASPSEFSAHKAAGDDSPSRLQTFLNETGMGAELHTVMVNASDDYILLLMQNADFGVRTTLRRFRLDPRVYVKSFVLQDAFSWFACHDIFSCATKIDSSRGAHAFLSRCCKERKLRLLVTHRGGDTQMFPFDRQHSHLHHKNAAGTTLASSVQPLSRSQSASATGPPESDVTLSQSQFPNEIAASERRDTDSLPEATYLQSMIFVDPWEVEAEHNVRRYMHNGHPPLHVELGWNRLSPVCLETCDGIVTSVFEDPDLVTMWKATAGESWLVTAITHYQLDGLHSYRTLYQHVERGLAGQEELRIPFLVEVYSRCQRNAMFEEAGLPHRFVGVVSVELVEAKDLIACSWIGTWSDPFVFLQLGHSNDDLQETADEWSLRTYRSPVGKGGVNPQWSTANNKYVFRFAIPTHRKHTARTARGLHFSGGQESARGGDAKDGHVISQLWAADVNDRNRAAVVALEKLLPSAFSGPPALLRCTMYHENKVLSHQFMGRAKVPLDELTCSNQMDCWLPLEDTTSGSLHVRISLSFQLMCSSTADR